MQVVQRHLGLGDDMHENKDLSAPHGSVPTRRGFYGSLPEE